jgi:hypothetical protein
VRLAVSFNAIQVSIPQNATNAELARQIAETLQQPSVTLEIGDGFELREQEYALGNASFVANR